MHRGAPPPVGPTAGPSFSGHSFGHRPTRGGGFSLLELLVALFVVVLVTSMATLNVGSGSRDLELESQLRQLADIASFAADEAQMSGRDHGLLLHRVQVDGQWRYRYAWRERRSEGWRRPERGGELFAGGDLPAEVELDLQLDDQIESEVLPLDDPARATPQVIYYASGEVSPGALDLRDREDGRLLWRLEWDLLGRSELLPEGERRDHDGG